MQMVDWDWRLIKVDWDWRLIKVDCDWRQIDSWLTGTGGI